MGMLQKVLRNNIKLLFVSEYLSLIKYINQISDYWSSDILNSIRFLNM